MSMMIVKTHDDDDCNICLGSNGLPAVAMTSDCKDDDDDALK